MNANALCLSARRDSLAHTDTSKRQLRHVRAGVCPKSRADTPNQPSEVPRAGVWGLGCERGGCGASVFPSRGAVEVGEEVLAGGFELVANQAEVEEEDPEIVLGGRRVKRFALAGSLFDAQGFCAKGQDQLDVSLDLARVKRCLKKPELDRAAVPNVVEV